MNSLPDTGIVLCQPDSGKGCSLCCGLFNFRDISRESLTCFLYEGVQREKNLPGHENFKIPDCIRDEFSHICPYQGFLSDKKPGCLIHPLSSGSEGRERSLFSTGICDRFFCPAHEILTDEEKTFLVENVKEWYLYSVAIADPESYSYIYSYVKSRTVDLPVSALMVNDGLAAHAENLASYHGIIFCYSIPEYNINKKNFSLNYSEKMREHVLERVTKQP